jgi:hypothetical protein
MVFHGDLPLLRTEAQMLVSTLAPRTVLRGEVTEERLRETITNGLDEFGTYDGIWIASHSSADTVQLTDGLLGRDALAQYVNLAGASWVVLNSCESEGLAASLADLGVDVVSVAVTDDGHGIDDRDALRMGTMLATRLEANGGDLQAAFDSVPNAKNYRFYSAAAVVTRAYQDDRKLGEAIVRLETKVDNLTKQMEEVITALKERPTASQVVGWVFLGSIVVLAIIALFSYLFQRGVL